MSAPHHTPAAIATPDGQRPADNLVQVVRHPENVARTAAIWLGGAALLFILWKASDVVFIAFAGMLVAAIFHGFANLMCRFLPTPFWVCLTIAILVLILLFAGGIALGGFALVTQIGDIVTLAREELGRLREMVAGMGLPAIGGGSPGDGVLPGGSSMMPAPSTAISSALGLVGNTVIVLFLGVFIALDPHVYRKGLVSLAPPSKREKFDEAILAGANRLGQWLLAQGLSMITLFVATGLALWLVGNTYWLPLAAIAALLAFVQTIGPLFAGAFIVLAGLTISPSVALWSAGVYTVILTIEANFTTPLIQRELTAIQPALVLITQLLFGALFGLAGVLFAVPMLAALLPFVERLYVEDALGGDYDGRADPA